MKFHCCQDYARACRWRYRVGRSMAEQTSIGEVKPLKTYNARDVELVDRAVNALLAMKP